MLLSKVIDFFASWRKVVSLRVKDIRYDICISLSYLFRESGFSLMTETFIFLYASSNSILRLFPFFQIKKNFPDIFPWSTVETYVKKSKHAFINCIVSLSSGITFVTFSGQRLVWLGHRIISTKASRLSIEVLGLKSTLFTFPSSVRGSGEVLQVNVFPELSKATK